VDSRVGDLAGLHVLVVDDNRDARHIFATVVTSFGATVTTATDAAAGLRALHRAPPDIVLCDLELPARDGIWLVHESRRQGITVPFIAISGLDFDERQLEEQGFEAYLRKPVDHEALVRAVLAIARRRT
jgi:CheY-like chemotaxis protein